MKTLEALIATLKDVKQELTKNVNGSYGGAPNSAGPAMDSMAMSEKEPHKDDPSHERKEQEKAQDIKEKAQEILDMHKGCHEVIKADANGQWSIEKSNAIKPFGQNIYDEAANIKRKANRTGDVVEGVGRNNAVHRYTTIGSSMSQAHDKAQEKKYRAQSKASLRTHKDMSPEERAAIEAKLGAKFKD